MKYLYFRIQLDTNLGKFSLTVLSHCGWSLFPDQYRARGTPYDDLLQLALYWTRSPHCSNYITGRAY